MICKMIKIVFKIKTFGKIKTFTYSRKNQVSHRHTNEKFDMFAILLQNSRVKSVFYN